MMKEGAKSLTGAMTRPPANIARNPGMTMSTSRKTGKIIHDGHGFDRLEVGVVKIGSWISMIYAVVGFGINVHGSDRHARHRV
jgi:hypothetical protein